MKIKFFRNPSAGSLVLSETGSLDRAKAAYERRKKNQAQESDMASVPGRVEITRVNPDDLIEELLKNTNLEQADDSAESKGLFVLDTSLYLKKLPSRPWFISMAYFSFVTSRLRRFGNFSTIQLCYLIISSCPCLIPASGLQLFIAKDGTAALGNHEVKSQMSTGVQVFKQVVMDDR